MNVINTVHHGDRGGGKKKRGQVDTHSVQPRVYWGICHGRNLLVFTSNLSLIPVQKGRAYCVLYVMYLRGFLTMYSAQSKIVQTDSRKQWQLLQIQYVQNDRTETLTVT